MNENSEIPQKLIETAKAVASANCTGHPGEYTEDALLSITQKFWKRLCRQGTSKSVDELADILHQNLWAIATGNDITTPSFPERKRSTNHRKKIQEPSPSMEDAVRALEDNN